MTVAVQLTPETDDESVHMEEKPKAVNENLAVQYSKILMMLFQ